MPKFENQKLKLFRLLEIMMSRTDRERGIDMSGIISALAEYGISAERKSIYSDFECLADLGFEVIKMQGTKRGRGGFSREKVQGAAEGDCKNPSEY